MKVPEFTGPEQNAIAEFLNSTTAQRFLLYLRSQMPPIIGLDKGAENVAIAAATAHGWKLCVDHIENYGPRTRTDSPMAFDDVSGATENRL